MADDPAVDRSDVRRVLRQVEVPGLDAPDEAPIERVSGGVNEVFAVGEHCVVKFATFSSPRCFRAGVAAYRLLGAYTDLPVPAVYAARPDEDPPVVVMERRPGASLDGFRDGGSVTDPDAVRALGAAIAGFDAVPEDAVDGYGFLLEVEDGARPRAVAEYDDCATWLLEYAGQFYEDPAPHDAVEAVAPDVLEWLRAERERLPSAPDPSVVVTDYSSSNLLTAEGHPPADPADLTGVIDLERAKVGPVEFTAVNAEYLLCRDVDDPGPVREALYDPLPFGPDVPRRDLYRVIAMGRSVGALALWYEEGGEQFRRRGEVIAAELRRIVS